MSLRVACCYLVSVLFIIHCSSSLFPLTIQNWLEALFWTEYSPFHFSTGIFPALLLQSLNATFLPSIPLVSLINFLAGQEVRVTGLIPVT